MQIYKILLILRNYFRFFKGCSSWFFTDFTTGQEFKNFKISKEIAVDIHNKQSPFNKEEILQPFQLHNSELGEDFFQKKKSPTGHDLCVSIWGRENQHCVHLESQFISTTPKVIHKLPL